MTKLEVSTNKALSLLAQVDGRDKLYKTCQYGSRLVWWVLQSKGADPKLLGKFSGLDGSFSEARRVFRLGGFIKWTKDLVREPFLSGNTALLPTFKFVSTLSNLIAECLDVFIWAAKIKVLNIDKKRWDWWRNLLWMITILYAIVDQIVAMKQILQQRKYLLQQKNLLEHSDANTPKHTTSDKTPIREQKIRLNSDIAEVHEKITNVIYTYIRYGCDLYMCKRMLQDNEHKGLYGLLGVVSGVIGLNQAWKKL